MPTLIQKHIKGAIPSPDNPHPAAVAYAANWKHWITLECGNSPCRAHWHAPAHPTTGEPDIAVWGRDILKCPICGTTTLTFVNIDPRGMTT